MIRALVSGLAGSAIVLLLAVGWVTVVFVLVPRLMGI